MKYVYKFPRDMRPKNHCPIFSYLFLFTNCDNKI